MKWKLLLCILFLHLMQTLYAADLRGDTLDIRNYILSLDLRDFSGHTLYGVAAVGTYAKMNGVKEINLDLLKLDIDSVLVNGRASSYHYNDSLLHIGFPKLLNKSDSALLKIYYHGKPGVLPGDFGGFYWDDTYAFNIGVSFTSDPHNYGRVWFPCFDNFSVRSHYEYFITTRAGDKAFCNGLLQDVKTVDSSNIWHWKLKEDIPSYLASVAVAPYQTIYDTVKGINGVVPVEFAVISEDTAILKKRFAHLHQAFHILEHYWGSYRWERVGYCMVPFEDGAMEHATNIAFMKEYLTFYARECETTMAHELSHHWFGDMVTCDSASEMWLNEGWADYSQRLFIEGLYGRDSAVQYQREKHLAEVQLAHVTDGGYLPVSGVPSRKTYGSTVYQKGGDVIHTLRYYLGDSTFFNCVKGYLNDYAFKTASTLQLQNYLSRCSGKDLTDFFNDWILSPGYPHFSIYYKYVVAVSGKYQVSVNIRQRLCHAPRLYSGVPITISYFDKNMKRKDELVIVSGESTIYSTTLDFNPVFIALDVDANLADAVSAESHLVSDTGACDFTNALMSVNVEAIKGPSLIRVEQSLMPAEAMMRPVKNLHLHNGRYWTVDGVFDDGMKATGIFGYSAIPADHLDGGFMANEDSLVMMYRPDQSAEWKLAVGFVVEKGEDDSDKVGAVIVSPLKKGEYAFAVYDSRIPAEVRKPNACKSILSGIKAGHDFKLSLDKPKEILIIAFQKNIFDRAEIYDSQHNKIVTLGIAEGENNITHKLSHVSTESYVVTLRSKSGNCISKKLNNQ